ncbi:U3 small nucleolar rna-associated protein [Thalictrum thalictroides]|uniref:U3 small nucleolar rna-associated protein n=1 Tax=Thalictrum thalictroides TaxID=46969 RepID=A0A7J6VET6_THATH|nr:U3 small nucleolar rna-associated protein [Thalictrum thalictroides]
MGKSFLSKKTSLGGSKYEKKNSKDEKKGPRLPSALQREVDSLNTRYSDNSDEEEELHDTDIYEYNEAQAEEESRKNRRYDPVDNLEYKLPDEFEDENLSSDDDDNNVDHASESKSNMNTSDESEDDVEEDSVGRHARMLQNITGMPAEVFDGKKQKFGVVSETYPESEYNPSRDTLDGDGRITIQDLLVPLQKKRGYSELNKRIQKVERKSVPVQTPISKVLQENVDRKVAYEHTKKDITKWELPVKRHREATTIFFEKDTNVGFSTVGAIASGFTPRTNFEKKMDSLINDAKVVEAYREDGARLLELNKISVEDVIDHKNSLAKMRSLLFRHEMKAKRIKKIKSKTYHRLLKKDKLKASHTEMQTDPEAAKEEAMKQEFKRAEERLTLKHKNNSNWAKRVKKRGLEAQDEGTRVAISEQLNQHADLTRKMYSMKESSSSDETSDEDDEDELSPDANPDGVSKLLTKAKEKTQKLLETEDEMGTSGVLSLPFMVREMKKRKEMAYAEAKLAIEDYESSLKQLEDTNGAATSEIRTSSGRRVFGAARKQPEESVNRTKSGNIDRDSDSDYEYKANDNLDVDRAGNGALQKKVPLDANMLRGESDSGSKSVYTSFDDTVRDPDPKTTYEVAIFASNSWKKVGNKNVSNGIDKKSVVVVEPIRPQQDLKEVDKDDTESEEEMVDGFLSSGTKADYELPSQEDLIRRAFAGDDVEEEFEKDKLEVLNEENPEPEKPLLLPGWGQWTHIQKKKGTPSWLLEEHESAKRKREESLKKRKDAHLKHVIISEKINKKVEKLHAKSLPYPYTSQEAFNMSMRVPIGPEFHPAASLRALNCPEVVKTPGHIIKPISFEEVNPHEKEDEQKMKGPNQKIKNKKSNNVKGAKKTKIKHKSN